MIIETCIPGNILGKYRGSGAIIKVLAGFAPGQEGYKKQQAFFIAAFFLLFLGSIGYFIYFKQDKMQESLTNEKAAKINMGIIIIVSIFGLFSNNESILYGISFSALLLFMLSFYVLGFHIRHLLTVMTDYFRGYIQNVNENINERDEISVPTHLNFHNFRYITILLVIFLIPIPFAMSCSSVGKKIVAAIFSIILIFILYFVVKAGNLNTGYAGEFKSHLDKFLQNNIFLILLKDNINYLIIVLILGFPLTIILIALQPFLQYFSAIISIVILAIFIVNYIRLKNPQGPQQPQQQGQPQLMIEANV